MMYVEGDPKYLYQYTSIETLALILKNKSIKFNSLKNVDDSEEVEAKDIKDFGKYAFVSCWTNDKRENIALWNMYTEKMKGIRIKLPYNCLNSDPVKIKKQLVHYGNNLQLVSEDPFTGSCFKCYEVKYTDVDSELFPTVWRPERSRKYPLLLNGLGRTKSTQWTFQNEWRYIIYTQLNNWLNEGEIIEIGRKRLEDFKEIPKGIYVDISNNAFKNMEILLGPRISDADIIIVEALVDKYNKGIKVSKSSIKINNKQNK